MNIKAGLQKYYVNYIIMIVVAFIGYLLLMEAGLRLPRSYVIGILLSPIAYLFADAILYEKDKGIIFRSLTAFVIGLPLLLLIPIGYYAGYYENIAITMLDLYWFIISYLTYGMAVSFSLMIHDGLDLGNRISDRLASIIIIFISSSIMIGITYAVASINNWGYVSCFL